MNEDQNNKMIDFASQPYFNQDNQEFLEVSFLVAIPEQKQIEILIDLETDNQQNVLEIQKQSGIKQIPIHLYQNQKLINNWILTRDQLE